MNSTVTYNEIKYPTKELEFADGVYTIGTEDLSSALIDDDNGEPVDDEAEAIDNTIFYYCTQEDFDNLSDEELVKKIEDEI